MSFDRRYSVTVDTIKIDKLDVSFEVTKTTAKEPNTVTLKIYNLNENHRNELAQLKKPMVEIEAGYEDEGIGLIFRGQVRNINSEKIGPDWITEINSGDGEDSLQTARVNMSFKPGTSLGLSIKKLAEEMKVGLGNSAKKALEGDFDGAANEFLNGVVLSGRASTELDGLLKGAGLEWSVQDNELQIMKLGEVLPGMAVVIDAEHGMIGSPTIGNDGILNVTTLMNWSIVPGRSLRVSSQEIPEAFYRAENCSYIGDTSGLDWYVRIEAKQT